MATPSSPSASPTPPSQSPATQDATKKDETNTAPPSEEKNPSTAGRDETLERLLSTKELAESVAGLWGWMSGSATQVVSTTKELAAKASVMAESLPAVAAAAAATVEQSATTILQQSMARVEGDAAAAPSSSSASASSLPWDALNVDRQEEAKERILKLSTDDRTFLVPPPQEATYVPSAEVLASAQRMLEVDPLLSSKRFKLVPKSVEEPVFWQNYFYRVHLITEALGGVSSSAKEARAEEEAEEAEAEASKEAPQASKPDWDKEARAQLAVADSTETFDMIDDDLAALQEEEDEDADAATAEEIERRIREELEASE